MKKIFIAILVCISLGSFAQQVNYQIVEDSPETHPKLSMNLDLAQIDFSLKMIDAASFNIGLGDIMKFCRIDYSLIIIYIKVGLP